MKKIILIAVIALLSATTFAQDFTGLKLLLNPGHGGHDSDDRFIAATGFWESEGNLDKALYLRDIMTKLGATIVMSRVTNTTADDLPLSQIVALANNNNVDWMHSNHSNATGTTAMADYTLMLYQGRTSAPTFPVTYTMSSYMKDEIYKAQRTTDARQAGDFDFYGTGQAYLGVFKGLTMPGTLSEGEFHDYVPMSWRLQNQAFKKHEAWAIARGFIKYWNKTPFTHGIAAGLVRDKYEKVTYSYMSGDDKKPVNFLTVTLQPGNKVYYGDNMNNGFYMFDSLAPGTYKLTFEAPNYCKDSATITVTANTSSFADIYMLPDTTVNPSIARYSPVNGLTDSVSANTPLTFLFSKPMDTTSVRGAFKISPKVDGIFTWTDSFQTLTFTPSLTYDRATTYTVTITKDAKSQWNSPLKDDFSFKFISKYRNRLSILSSYPLNGQKDLSTQLQSQIIFDAPTLSTISLNNCVAIFDDQNTRLTIKNAKRFNDNGKGYIYFEPKDELQKNKIYKILVLGTCKDVDNIPLYDTVAIYFSTTAEKYVSGNIVDSLESTVKWLLPKQSSNSTGIDTIVSAATISSIAKISGSYSGRFSYEFTKASGGVCEFIDGVKPVIPAASASNFGMWIFGDNSKNILEYWFAGANNTIDKVVADTINWTGWKIVSLPISKIPGTGDRVFTSIVIRQTPIGFDSSSIFVDDIQYNFLTPVKDGNITVNPSSFTLNQNYPNPFNPSTVISWQMPKAAKVSLKVYDVLGRVVANLIDEERPSGNYKITFDVNKYNLASGVYLYKLQAGEFSETKKMILNK